MVPRISSRHSSKRTRSWSAAKEGFTVSHSNQERTNNNVDSEARHRLLPWTGQGDREWFPSFSRKRAQMRRTVEYCGPIRLIARRRSGVAQARARWGLYSKTPEN